MVESYAIDKAVERAGPAAEAAAAQLPWLDNRFFLPSAQRCCWRTTSGLIVGDRDRPRDGQRNLLGQPLIFPRWLEVFICVPNVPGIFRIFTTSPASPVSPVLSVPSVPENVPGVPSIIVPSVPRAEAGRILLGTLGDGMTVGRGLSLPSEAESPISAVAAPSGQVRSPAANPGPTKKQMKRWVRGSHPFRKSRQTRSKWLKNRRIAENQVTQVFHCGTHWGRNNAMRPLRTTATARQTSTPIKVGIGQNYLLVAPETKETCRNYLLPVLRRQLPSTASIDTAVEAALSSLRQDSNFHRKYANE